MKLTRRQFFGAAASALASGVVPFGACRPIVIQCGTIDIGGFSYGFHPSDEGLRLMFAQCERIWALLDQPSRDRET